MDMSQDDWLNELYEQMDNEQALIEFYLTTPSEEAKKLEITNVEVDHYDEYGNPVSHVDLEFE